MLPIGALRFIATLASAAVFLSVPFAKPVFAASDPLPQEIRSAGVIRFAGDFTAAPAVYFDENHAMQGADYEICNAIATHLGVKAEWTNVVFGGLIPALTAGRADATCSAMYVTPERLRVAAFVPYRLSGHGAVVEKGNPHNVHDLADTCGLSAVEVLGTVYEKMIKKQSEACVTAGKAPVDLKTFATAADAAEQVTDARADIWLAGDTILDYYLQKSGGALRKVFSRKGLTLIGIGVLPQNIVLGKAFSRALFAMKADGSYEAILAKYGISQEKIDAFDVRPVAAAR